MDSFEYSPETVEHARTIYSLLALRVANKLLTPLTYGQIAERIGIHPRAMKFPLAKIQDECRDKGWPTITVLVVDQSTGMPNSGCDAYGERAVARARAELGTVEWPDQAWW